MSGSCKKCPVKLPLSNASALKTHNRLYHQPACKVYIDSLELLIPRSVDGEFSCPVVNCNSFTPSNDPLPLQKHAHTVHKKTSSPGIAPPPRPRKRKRQSSPAEIQLGQAVGGDDETIIKKERGAKSQTFSIIIPSTSFKQEVKQEPRVGTKLRIGQRFANLQAAASALKQYDPDLAFNGLEAQCVYHYRPITKGNKYTERGFHTDCQARVRIETIHKTQSVHVTSFSSDHNHRLLSDEINTGSKRGLFQTPEGIDVLPPVGTHLDGTKIDIFAAVAKYAYVRGLDIQVKVVRSAGSNEYRFDCESKGCLWKWHTKQLGTSGWRVSQMNAVHDHPVRHFGISPPPPPSPAHKVPSSFSTATSSARSMAANSMEPRTQHLSALQITLLKIDPKGSLLPFEQKMVDNGFDLEDLAKLPDDVVEKFLTRDIGLSYLQALMVATWLEHMRDSNEI